MQCRVLHVLLQVDRRRRGSVDDDEQRLASLARDEPLARELVERASRTYGPDEGKTLEGRVLLADTIHEQGRHRAAADSCRAILASSVERLGDCHNARIRAMYVLADALARMGDDYEPAELYLKRIECVRRQVSPESPALLSILSDSLPHLDRAERASDGETVARELNMTLRKLGGGHSNMLFGSERYLARFASMQNRLDEAEVMFQALFSREAQASELTRNRLQLFYGSHLRRRGAFEQARQYLETVVARTGDVRRGTWRSRPDDVIVEFIALYDAWGKLEQASEYRRLRQECIDSRSRSADE